MKFSNLSANYKNISVFHGLNGELKRNQVTTLLGPNGSGKTTLMLILADLKKPQIGNVIYKEQSLFYLAQKNQVFDYITVEQLLEIAILRNKNRNLEFEETIMSILELKELLSKDLNNLSGGQQQRVWLAYAFLQPAKILLLDEPLTYLDVKYQQIFYRLLMQEKKRGRTFLISLHDINFAKRCSDNIWYLTPTVLVTGNTDTLLTKDLICRYLDVEDYLI